MRIEALSLQNFRNISDMEIIPHSCANIIYGDNAQGKTNILEAIWLFTGARSFRGSKDGELTFFEEKFARLALKFYAKDRIQSASIYFEGEKTVRCSEHILLIQDFSAAFHLNNLHMRLCKRILSNG